MIETPADFNGRERGARYPGENLSRFSYHTGGTLRPVQADEPCPVLFRDLGLTATIRFLRSRLTRLAGPLSPITYLRTEAYVEPYTDHEGIGRLVFLRPLLLQPWYSGVEYIYVAPALRTADPLTIGFIPGSVSLADASRLAADLHNTHELREALGGRHHDELASETLHRLEATAAELELSEQKAAPLRECLQSPDPACRELACREMTRAGITEHDLCAAWHHLPRQRRALLREALEQIAGHLPEPEHQR
jgi:hypothetical protein